MGLFAVRLSTAERMVTWLCRHRDCRSSKRSDTERRGRTGVGRYKAASKDHANLLGILGGLESGWDGAKTTVPLCDGGCEGDLYRGSRSCNEFGRSSDDPAWGNANSLEGKSELR